MTKTSTFRLESSVAVRLAALSEALGSSQATVLSQLVRAAYADLIDFDSGLVDHMEHTYGDWRYDIQCRGLGVKGPGRNHQEYTVPSTRKEA